MSTGAMILAAGIGSRLAPLTTTTPKSLIDVGGITMLEVTLAAILRAGVKEITVNLHHLPEAIPAFIAKRLARGIDITYSFEPEILDIGGGVLNCKPSLGRFDNFFVYSADVFTDIDLKALLHHHQQSSAAVTMFVAKRETQRKLLFASDGRFAGISYPDRQEIHGSADGLEARNYKGIMVMSRQIFDLCSGLPAKLSLVDLLLAVTRRGGRVQAFECPSAVWFDIGTPERLSELRSWLAAHPDTVKELHHVIDGDLSR